MEPILQKIKNTTVLLCVVLLWTSCSDDSATKPDPRKLFVTSWTLGDGGHVIKDGVDVTDDYTGLTIIFLDNNTYATEAGGMLLKPSGTWDWASTEATQILMDGDFPVHVEALSKKSLALTFTMDIDHANTGRNQEVLGEFELLLFPAE